MYFVNETTKAVTDKDLTFLRQICVLLRTLCFVNGRQKKTNPHFATVQMECHSIARLLSLIFKELTLIDGVIVGFDLLPEQGKVTPVQTYHSWLITPDGAIIDPYPMGLIATTSALLIPTSNTRYCVHGGNFYHKNPRVREQFSSAECWRNARSCLRTLRKYSREEDMCEIIESII